MMHILLRSEVDTRIACVMITLYPYLHALCRATYPNLDIAVAALR